MMDESQLSRKVALETGRFGARAVCTEPINAGEVLFQITGRLVRRPDRHSVQLGAEVHLTPEGAAWSLVNHSCTPNIIIDFDRWELVAHRPIAAGEELGWNYLTTEWDLSSPFQCGCADQDGHREILGFRYLSLDERRMLRPFVSPFIKSWFFRDLSRSAFDRVACGRRSG